MQYEIEIGGSVRQLSVHRADGRFRVTLDGREVPVDAARVGPDTWSLLVDGVSHEVTVSATGPAGAFLVGIGPLPIALSLNGRRRWGRKEESGTGGGAGRVVAPMPGKIVKVLVKPGDRVAARQPLIVIEAMKMENELRAAGAGTVAEIHASEGLAVDAGSLLVVLAALK
jgi:biotin carboxyl carrier protein